MADMTEKKLDELVLRCAEGDEDAFRRLYDEVAPRLLAIAMRLIGDRQQAEDVLQQAMLAAWRSAGDYDPGRAQATTWLTSIVRYRSLDVLRRRSRRKEVLSTGEQDIASVFGHDIPVSAGEPVSERLAARLDDCFGEISRDEAACIQFIYLDGLTFAELAARLERSIGTVKSWVRRGLQKLKVCVER